MLSLKRIRITMDGRVVMGLAGFGLVLRRGRCKVFGFNGK